MSDVVRLAGASRSGEVRADGCTLYNWCGRAVLPNICAYDEGVQDFETGHGEGAPIHINAASARCFGPTLVVKLSNCRDLVAPRPMQLAAWRRVSILAIPFGHTRDRAHSYEGCLSP